MGATDDRAVRTEYLGLGVGRIIMARDKRLDKSQRQNIKMVRRANKRYATDSERKQLVALTRGVGR